MSEIIGNRYQITKLIGKGGMAEVYLAWDNILNREVAIKILKSDMSDDDVALERFNREAGSATQLSHPNIVDVYDVGEDKDKHYIVMEYVKGYTLKQLIKKRGAIPYKEAVWMIKQLAGALMEAHRKGIIHRDVKSQNVLIKPDGTIKLSDFGIALANGSMQITSKDSVLGSVHYLAPELTRGKQASMQSDIYSLGIVFYELLTGDVPFKGETPVQVALMHVKGSIPSVKGFNPTIPQSIENILIKATAKSTSNRYKNIALMLKDLNDCLKPEHKNDKKIMLDDLKENGVKQTMQAADELQPKEKKKLPKLFIILATVISIAAIIAILFLSGIIGNSKKITTVPNVLNLTVLEAKDILSESNLILDEANISYELTESTEKDKIISLSPNVGEEVDINTKVKIKVSDGIYSILDNYVGKNYLEAKADLDSKKFYVRLVPDSNSDLKPGTVISQDKEEGFKYDGSVNNEITLKYVPEISVTIDPSIKNNSLDFAREFFIQNNIEYKFESQDKLFFTVEELLNANPYTVLRTDPEIGSSYQVDSNIVVHVYYYEEGESE